MPSKTLLERLHRLGRHVAPAAAAATVLIAPTVKAQDSRSPQKPLQTNNISIVSDNPSTTPYQELTWLNDTSLELNKWFYQEPVEEGFRRTPISKIDEAVLKNGKLDLIQNGWHQTLLTAAIMNGKVRTVDLLLSAGASPDQKNGFDQHPLSLAVQTACRDNNPNRLSIIKSLIKAGAQQNVTDTDGRTPLMTAALHKKTQIMDLLISAGADKDRKDNDGQTARDLYNRQTIPFPFAHALSGIEK